MKKNIVLLFSLVLLFSFAALSKYEDRSFMRSLDFAVTVKVQEKIDTTSRLRLAAFAANIMEWATFFASPEFTVVVALVLTAVWLRTSKKALCIPLLLAVLVAVEIYAKSVVHHPSPPFSMIKNPTTLFPANYVNEQFSFPSGHAARAVFLAILSYIVYRMSNVGRKHLHMFLIVGLIGYVFLVGISRIYLGHHWFSDVVGGVLLGGGIGVLTWAIMAPYNTRTMSD